MFKQCPKCKASWLTREQFLEDPEINFIGYQNGVKNQQSGFFLFNHICRGTLALSIFLFSDLHDGPVKSFSRSTSSENYCLLNKGMMPCPAHCSCEYIFSVSEKINIWNKVTN